MSTATARDIINAAYYDGDKFSQNGPCDGLHVTDTTYINAVDTRIDMDYIQAYLIQVCDRDLDATEHYMGPERGMEPSQTGETWVSYLAVIQHHAGLAKIDFCWYDGDEWATRLNIPNRRTHSPRIRFFQQDADYATDVRHWFLDWVHSSLEGW